MTGQVSEQMRALIEAAEACSYEELAVGIRQMHRVRQGKWVERCRQAAAEVRRLQKEYGLTGDVTNPRWKRVRRPAARSPLTPADSDGRLNG
jgi:hypothetical protein